MRYAPLADTRLVAAVLLFLLRGEAHAKGAGVKAGTQGAAMGRARAPGP